jgi:hypothetical protein
VPRPSPFADVTDGPAADAVIIEFGRPTARALGCLGMTALFLAALGLAAISYGLTGVPGPRVAVGWFRPFAAVLGVVFVLVVAALVTAAVKTVRGRQGLAFDASGVWWRADELLVRVPWSDLVAARLVTPVKIRYLRTSSPQTTTVELVPVDDDTIRRYPQLTDKIIAGDALPGIPLLRFGFRLPSSDDATPVADALARFAPALLAAGSPADDGGKGGKDGKPQR